MRGWILANHWLPSWDLTSHILVSQTLMEARVILILGVWVVRETIDAELIGLVYEVILIVMILMRCIISTQLLLLKLLRHDLDIGSTLRELIVVQLNRTALEACASACCLRSSYTLYAHSTRTTGLLPTHLLSIEIRWRQISMMHVLGYDLRLHAIRACVRRLALEVLNGCQVLKIEVESSTDSAERLSCVFLEWATAFSYFLTQSGVFVYEEF